MFLSSHNLGGHRNRNSDVEDEGIRDPSSHIVNRFSTSSTDSQDGFEFTALINLQNLRSKVSRAGWGLKTCCWKRPSLVVIIVFIFLLVAAMYVRPCSSDSLIPSPYLTWCPEYGYHLLPSSYTVCHLE